MDMAGNDVILLKILQESGSITGFIGVVSSFLKRSTEWFCAKKLESCKFEQLFEDFIVELQKIEGEQQQQNLETADSFVGHSSTPTTGEEIAVETQSDVLENGNELKQLLVFPAPTSTEILNSVTPQQTSKEPVSPVNKSTNLRYILPKTVDLDPSNSTLTNALRGKRPRRYKCSECPDTFVSFRQVKVHQAKHFTPADGVNICNYCCSLYANFETLENHIKDCHANGRFVCLPCTKSYKSRGQLLKHVHSDTHKATALIYYCSLCPRSSKTFVEFTTRSALQQHFREMHLLMPINRGEEDDIEMNEEFLDEFLLNNRDENSFHFSECWEALDLNLPDMLHMPAADESSSNKQNLLPEKDAFICPKCYESYANQKTLLQHMAEKHLLQVLICGKCELSFQDYTKWLQHKSTHRQQSEAISTFQDRLQCGVCDKIFRSNASLIYHMKTHTLTNVRPHECPYCGKCFRTDLNFKQHLRIVHSQIKRHICELCDKQFATLDHLKKHVLSQHQNERKHVCHICEKRFTQLSHIKQHLSIHTTGKTIKCNFCDAKFWRKIDVERHTLRKHLTN